MQIPRRAAPGIALMALLAFPDAGRTQGGGRRPPPAAPATQTAADSGRDTALYNADRPLDFLHMRLEITFSPEGLRARTCEGRVEYTLRPKAAKISSVRLDAVDMQILGVELSEETKAPAFAYDDKHVTVQLPRPRGQEETFKLAVKYRLADPSKGMHFVLPTASRPKRPIMVYTMSEPLEARYWFPTHDWPNVRWTSDIVITVPAEYTAVSNGLLHDKKTAADGKSVTFHWHNDVPTDPHLVGLVLGKLVELRDTWRGRPVITYTQPGLEAAAKYTFRRVPEIIEFYTQLLGVDFPYPAYTHITVVDHHHGGMEHAGFSFVDPRFIAVSEDSDCLLEDTESIYISHMLAHQWFAGMVNYRSVSQAWLNEGFAILLDSSWTSHTDSPERFNCKMWETARRVAGSDSSETGKPLVVRDLPEVGDIYLIDGSKVYYKGGWVLNMLRHRLGDKLFWHGVGNYLRQHQWQGVETSDLRRALEEVSGQDLEQFFEQWVYGHGVPRLEVSYAWDVGRNRATVTVRQTQKIDKVTPAFAFPLDLCFRVGEEDKTQTVTVTDARHEFTFDFPSEPSVLCVDPKGHLLKTLDLKVPRAMVRRQALEGPTALARLMAVESLGGQPGAEVIETLGQVLRKESEFWMVRRSAAEGLGRMQTAAALPALLESEKANIQNPRALAGLLQALGGFVASPEAHAAVLGYAGSAKSLYVATAAVSALGRLRANPQLIEKSVQVLETAAQKPTPRAVRISALGALAALDDPRSYETVFKLAQPGGDDDLRENAIRALGRLGRHDDFRDRTRTVLTAWLYDPDTAAQEAAAGALGGLGDPRAIADLERIRASARKVNVRRAAEGALAELRRPEDPRQATSAVLERLRVIEKQNQELEKKLKELSSRLEAPKKASEEKGDKVGAKK
jgi:aminopeptidase N